MRMNKICAVRAFGKGTALLSQLLLSANVLFVHRSLSMSTCFVMYSCSWVQVVWVYCCRYEAAGEKVGDSLQAAKQKILG